METPPRSTGVPLKQLPNTIPSALPPWLLPLLLQVLPSPEHPPIGPTVWTMIAARSTVMTISLALLSTKCLQIDIPSISAHRLNSDSLDHLRSSQHSTGHADPTAEHRSQFRSHHRRDRPAETTRLDLGRPLHRNAWPPSYESSWSH
jgi:hypothetical protein